MKKDEKKPIRFAVISVVTVLIAIPLLAFIVTKTYLHFTYEFDEKPRILEGMGERYGEEFEFDSIYSTASWQDTGDTREAVVTNKNYPEEKITVRFNGDKYLKNPEKWSDSFVAVKYKKQFSEEIEKIAKQYYGENAFAVITTAVCDLPTDADFNIVKDNVDKAYGVYIINEKTLSSRDDDAKAFIKALSENGFNFSVGIYYYNALPEYKEPPNSTMLLSSALVQGRYYPNDKKILWYTTEWYSKENQINNGYFAEETIID